MKRTRYKYSATYYRRVKKCISEARRAELCDTIRTSGDSTADCSPNPINQITRTTVSIPSAINEQIGQPETSSTHDPGTPDENANVLPLTGESSGEESEPEWARPADDDYSSLKCDLKQWVAAHNISHQALGDLLRILRGRTSENLPLDPRTLLKTPLCVVIEPMGAGEFWFRGLENCLLSGLSGLAQRPPNALPLNFNIDGIPTSKSSRHEFWPILVSIASMPSFQPDVVAIWSGKSKPPDAYSFLTPFVNELKDLMDRGLIIQGQRVSVSINAFICDTPARSFIKCIKGSNAYSGCSKCTVIGTYDKGGRHMSFPRITCSRRTDKDFRAKTDSDHHLIKINAQGDDEFLVTPLEKLPIDLIVTVPVSDSLHLLDLGVMKKCLVGWTRGSYNFKVKFFKPQIEEISKWMIHANKTKPSEINRSFRALDDLAFWKGVEFRHFLLYLGPVILKKHLPSELYNHFLMFSCAITICSSNHYLKTCKLLHVAKQLLQDYIELYITHYGIDSVSSNVHNLCHLADEVEHYGTLDNISSYPFENRLGSIKRLLKSGNRPLAQVAKRITERSEIFQSCSVSPPFQCSMITSDPTKLCQWCPKAYLRVEFNNTVLAATVKDQWVLDVNSSILKIISIYPRGEHLYIMAEKLLGKKETYFTYPFLSNRLDIYSCTKLEFSSKNSYALNSIKCKLFYLTNDETHVFFPLLHTLGSNFWENK